MTQDPESKIQEAHPMIGGSVSHYTIEALLGEDVTGIIYKSRDNEAAKDIIVKILHPAVAADSERMQKYKRDAMAVSALKHANIARVYDFAEVNGIAFIAMEPPEGE